MPDRGVNPLATKYKKKSFHNYPSSDKTTRKHSIQIMPKTAFLFLFASCCAELIALRAGPAPAEYNVVWNSQSKDSGDSMPCVGGDIGLNVWVENDELLFYIGRAGCRDENGSLLKMGRVRLSIDPSPFSEDAEFSQTLNLQSGGIDIVTHIEQADTIDTWHRALDTKVREVRFSDLRTARQSNQSWWDAFWARSYIHINPGRGESDTGWRLGRNYALFRYMLASGLNGREPIMFNGGVLTFDPIYAAEKFKGAGYTPDHRQWGAALTAQNQRCMYWPMLKSGDHDLLMPGFDYYRDGLTNARERTRHYWGHEGCSFTEQITIQWLPGAMVYGYAGERFKGKTHRYRPEDVETGVCVNKAVNYIYESQLEWSWMILEYHRFTGADISDYLPLIEQSVIFYDEHYRMREKQRSGKELTGEGKLHIRPTNTLEGHPGGSNPTSVIAGLQRVLKGLIAITDDAERRKRWQGILATLPDMPTAEVDGRTVLIPTTEHKNFSWHMPSMYPLYPYQIHQLGKPGHELMRDTFLHGISEKARMDHRA